MSSGSKKQVFVGMSGGVDSSVAAFLLKKDGYDVTGVYINGFNVDGCSERDSEDARRVADHLGIPFYVIDAREDYFEYVVQYMIDGYKKGLTPNPDVMCNKEIKFGVFLDKALKLGADYIATGHYVKLARGKGQVANERKDGAICYKLFAARDAQKDQSYFLWTLKQEQLKHCLFPVGEYTKADVREIAKKAGLPTAEKKDSQGICFLGKVKLPDFLKEYIKPKKGDVVDTEGNKIGEHDGVQFYTIGQRRINIIQKSPPKAGQPRAEKNHVDRKPYYVVEKDIKTNTLVVAEGDDNPALFKKEVELTNVHFISPPENYFPIRANRKIVDEERIEVLARVRYRQQLVKATLVISNKKPVISKERNLPITSYQLLFSEPVKFIAPGQSAVFYSRDGEMLGGGVILE